MRARFEFEARYQVTCSVCGAEPLKEQFFPIANGQTIPWPSLPEGWRVLDGQPICDKHKIKVGKAAKVWEKGA